MQFDRSPFAEYIAKLNSRWTSKARSSQVDVATEAKIIKVMLLVNR